MLSPFTAFPVPIFEVFEVRIFSRRPEFRLTKGGLCRCDEGWLSAMRTDSLAGVAVFSVSTSVSPESSFKEVQPSMKDAIPLTMRSPLKRSTLSRAPIILCQHLSHVLLVLTEEEKALRDQLFATYRALLDKHQLLQKSTCQYVPSVHECSTSRLGEGRQRTSQSLASFGVFSRTGNVLYHSKCSMTDWDVSCMSFNSSTFKFLRGWSSETATAPIT